MSAPLSPSQCLTRPPVSRGRMASRTARCSILAQATKTVTKDITSGILQTALSAGLAGRLRSHQGIHVDVRSTASDLAQGVFGGMVIKGFNWETPLSLTADAIEVDVGELLLDYMALVMNSSIALRNLPTGSCKLRLTAADMGNFMSHPLLKPVSDTAVQGKSFVWDRNSVHIGQDDKGSGFVDFEGRWGEDGANYKVRMIPMPSVKPGGSCSLKVSARKLASADKDSSSSSETAGKPDIPLKGPGSGAAIVAQGLGQMFSSLQLNLDGIELRSPSLEVLLPGQEVGGFLVQQPMLEIQMKMRIRSVPPLNMQF